MSIVGIKRTVDEFVLVIPIEWIQRKFIQLSLALDRYKPELRVEIWDWNLTDELAIFLADKINFIGNSVATGIK